MLKKYKTFLRDAHTETEVKKSKFIGQAFCLSSESQTQEILEGLRKKHRGANHNCYAYQAEGQTVTERFSDDGEPSGTAGMPILDVLRGAGIVNGLIVVTRYFGGTLLGTGGLVKAYTEAAKGAVTAAGIIEKEIYVSVNILCDYTLSGKIEYELKKARRPIDAVIYTHQVEFKVFIPIDEVSGFCEKITDLSHGAAYIESGPQIYGGIAEGKFIQL